MTPKYTRQIKGWKVYEGETVELRPNVTKIKWKAISKMFVVRSSADQFCALMQKERPGALIEVQDEYFLEVTTRAA